MAKESKKKYNPKVTFDGSFEDLLGLTFNKPKKAKYKVGDIVLKTGDDKRYTVYANFETELMPQDSEYAIQTEDGKITLFVKEVDILLYTQKE